MPTKVVAQSSAVFMCKGFGVPLELEDPTNCRMMYDSVVCDALLSNEVFVVLNLQTPGYQSERRIR